MKQRWPHTGSDPELESLQTDVMRFVAILGLCLAAIFSLVNTPPPAVPAQPAPAPAVVEVADREPAPSPDSELITRPVVPSPPMDMPRPAPDTPPSVDAGFSLEFESDDALLTLLQRGEVRLYAEVSGQFWALSGDRFSRAAQAPASYHAMHADTVPGRLREQLRRDSGVDQALWGVQLPVALLQELDARMQNQRGGRLLIDANAGVRLE